MWRLTTAFMLTAGLMLPATAGARTEQGGHPVSVSGHQWRVSATLACQRNSANARVCDELLGPLLRITVDMNIRQNNPTPGIAFTATYTATTSPLFPGAGLRPYGSVCAFGLVSSQRRFVRGPFVAFPTCRATVRGRMILRPGVATRMSKTPDFWITSETATVPGALAPLIVDPLGARSYPFDTRIPVVWKALDSVRGTKRVLGILGIPGFSGQTVLLPAALSASMTIKTLVFTKVSPVGGSGGRNSGGVSRRDAPGPAPFRGPTIAQDRTTSEIGAPFRYGPWKFVDAVPQRNLVISVYGSYPRATVYRIGMVIV